MYKQEEKGEEGQVSHPVDSAAWVKRKYKPVLNLEPQNGFLGIDLSGQERHGKKDAETLLTLLPER